MSLPVPLDKAQGSPLSSADRPMLGGLLGVFPTRFVGVVVGSCGLLEGDCPGGLLRPAGRVPEHEPPQSCCLAALARPRASVRLKSEAPFRAQFLPKLSRNKVKFGQIESLLVCYLG
jgi:hypothetical protein